MVSLNSQGIEDLGALCLADVSLFSFGPIYVYCSHIKLQFTKSLLKMHISFFFLGTGDLWGLNPGAFYQQSYIPSPFYF